MSSDQGYYKKGFAKAVSNTHAWRTVENAVPYVIPYLKKTDKLLDVGLGPGTILRDFANYVGQVVGVEPTQELVDLASNQADLPELVLFQLALAYRLPFDDNSFDVVHALQVVVHLENPIQALQEMLRVCKPGGYILVKDGDLRSTMVYPEKYAAPILSYFRLRFENLSTLEIAGRSLKERAIQAGYDPKRIQLTFLVWTKSSEQDRKEWADMFIARILEGAEVDIELNRAQIDKTVEAFQDWKLDGRGVMCFFHGELVYQK